MADDVKRAYRSEARAASAAATRARIRDAAARLFVERGYVATTMREVASAAGVGERTLYDAFPTKAARETAESKRGWQSQSIDPSLLTSAPAWLSPRSA